jgi:excisionase family DNA binding protein
MNEQQLLSTKEAALIVRKSAPWLLGKGRRLGIPCYRIGGRWLFPKDELEAWKEAQRYVGSKVTTIRSGGYVMRQKVAL